jgi:hypothetical protein
MLKPSTKRAIVKLEKIQQCGTAKTIAKSTIDKLSSHYQKLKINAT